MKKLISKETFSFQYDGETVLEISPKGCLATEEQAKTVLNRFPFVTSEDVKSVEKEIKKVAEEKPQNEEKVAEEKPRNTSSKK